jgi:hypothetical protein
MNVQQVEKLPFNIHEIFQIQSEEEFLHVARLTFHFQYKHNEIYRQYVDLSGKKPDRIEKLEDIPFLPISFLRHMMFAVFSLTNLLFLKAVELLDRPEADILLLTQPYTNYPL